MLHRATIPHHHLREERQKGWGHSPGGSHTARGHIPGALCREEPGQDGERPRGPQEQLILPEPPP